MGGQRFRTKVPETLRMVDSRRANSTLQGQRSRCWPARLSLGHPDYGVAISCERRGPRKTGTLGAAGIPDPALFLGKTTLYRAVAWMASLYPGTRDADLILQEMLTRR
jgi:hypothetical protein